MLAARRYYDEITDDFASNDSERIEYLKSITMEQRVRREDQPLFTATVQIVVMTLEGRPTRLPAEIRALLDGKS